MPWTAPRTWVANELVTAAIMNTHVRDNLLQTATVYNASFFRTTDQLIPANVATAFVSTTNDYDTDSMTGTTDRLIVRTAGKYLFLASIRWETNTTGYRQCWLERNGSIILATDIRPVVSSGDSACTISSVVSCVANDYVRLIVFHTASISINLTGASQPRLTAQRLSAN